MGFGRCMVGRLAAVGKLVVALNDDLDVFKLKTFHGLVILEYHYKY